MQNSMWKFATLLGVIGVGCLVIMQIQKGLPSQQASAASELNITPAGDAVPAATQSQDPFAGMAAAGQDTFSLEQFEPGSTAPGPADFGGEPIAQASYQEPERIQVRAPAADAFGAAAFEDDAFGAAPAQQEPPADDFFGNLGDAAAEQATELTSAATSAGQATVDAGRDAIGALDNAFDDLTAPAAADDFNVTPSAPNGGGGLFDDAVAQTDQFGNESAGAPQELPPTGDVFGNEVAAEPYTPEPYPAEPVSRTQENLSAPVLPGFEETREDQWGPESYEDSGMVPQSNPVQGIDNFAVQTPNNPTNTSGYPQDERNEPVRREPARILTPPMDDYRPDPPSGLRRISGTQNQKSVDSVPHGTLRPQLRIEKSAPGSASIGKPLVYSIRVKNVGNAVANEVIVEDQIPRGADLTGTIPQAELVEGILVWRFESLQPQEQKEVKIRVVPTREGQIGSVATVNFKAEIGSRTTVTAPRLRLELQGAQEARVGDTVEFLYRVINEGSGDATNVWIRNPLPEHLTHPQGNELEYEVGDLAAGKSREVTLQLVAYKPGNNVTNPAVVVADGIDGARAEARLRILGAQLKVTRRGPSRRYLNRNATYENTVFNTTNRDADNATLIEQVPDGMKFVQANNDGQYNEIKRTITWPIRRIRAGERQVFTSVLAPLRAGVHESIVQIVERGGNSRATTTTEVVHLDNMGLQLSQLDGPVEVGERVTFTINVRNRGTSTATGSVLTLEIPPELTDAVAGPTQARIEGTKLIFPPVDQIPPGGQRRFQVAFTASRSARDIRILAAVRSDQMPKSLSEAESITIYGDDNSDRR